MSDTTRPDNWQLRDHDKVTKLDYYGQPYEAYERIKRGPDYSKLWNQFSEDFKNQELRELRGGNSYNPPMELIEWNDIERG